MKHHHSIKKANMLYGMSIIAFLSGLHLSIPSYFNSSFLATFLDEKNISLIYLIISTITICGLLTMQSILRKFGNLKTSIVLIIIQIITFYGLITYTDPNIILPLFIIGMSIISLIVFTIDIFIQRNTDLVNTGSTRGLIMMATNIAWILGPLLGGILITTTGNQIASYRLVYFAGFGLLFPLLYLIYKNFNNFKDSSYINISARQTLIRIIRDRDISRIFIINIVLQTFYAWMIVYIPIYLHNVINFDWTEISIIFTIMLVPFVLLDVPLGKLADKRYGEKEILFFGFLILGISTLLLFIFNKNSVIVWSILLFMTRIGAATAEIMIETYFFKKIDGKDPEVLSIFRITRPLSYFIAPIIVTISLVYLPEQYLFVVFGVLCLFTLYPIFTIRDTN